MKKSVGIALLLAAHSSAVTPVPADPLISPAHYFDLQGKLLRFTPSPRGYLLKSMKAKPPADPGSPLGRPDFPYLRSNGWRVPIPFAFPFAGATWRELFVSSAGDLTFGRPEAELYPERDTWADGTMQSVGSSLNNRAASGQEKMICVFWGLNSRDPSKSRVFLRSTTAELTVTWQVERNIQFGEGYLPLGPNIFQATLRPNGAIELSYPRISEKDGIIGLFTGAADWRHLLTIDGRPAPTKDPRVKIRSVEAAISGKTLRFTFHMESPIASSLPEGRLWYRIFLHRGAQSCEIGLEVDRGTRPYTGRDCRGTPGFHVDGNQLELFATALELAGLASEDLRWTADVLWARRPGLSQAEDIGQHPLALPTAALTPPHLSAGTNPFEVFHYPHVNKSVFPHLRHIYTRHEPRDDMAVVLTDFRIDDLHNHQGSTGAGYGVAIQGIGDRPARINGGVELTGSQKLQVATGPIYLGPRFDEFLTDGDRHYRNYANAVGWMAHELCHRWGMELKFRNPHSSSLETLHETGHWSAFLNTPSMYSVWQMFSDKPYSEKSQMEGYVYEELSGGRFRRVPRPWNLPTGFSALDLYAMGMIGRDEVPDTYLIDNPRPEGPNLFRGLKIPVRIEDVIAASGERVPNAREAQKEFTLGIYLLHESNRPPDEGKRRQAEGIEKSLIEYFRVATGGRMHLRVARPNP